MTTRGAIRLPRAPSAHWMCVGGVQGGRSIACPVVTRTPFAQPTSSQPPPIVFPALPFSERDRLYERAERVGALLSHLGEQLKEAIADVNDSTGG